MVQIVFSNVCVIVCIWLTYICLWFWSAINIVWYSHDRYEISLVSVIKVLTSSEWGGNWLILNSIHPSVQIYLVLKWVMCSFIKCVPKTNLQWNSVCATWWWWVVGGRWLVVVVVVWWWWWGDGDGVGVAVAMAVVMAMAMALAMAIAITIIIIIIIIIIITAKDFGREPCRDIPIADIKDSYASCRIPVAKVLSFFPHIWL